MIPLTRPGAFRCPHGARQSATLAGAWPSEAGQAVGDNGNVSLPEPRIGDAERDDAANLLQEHLAAGRITHAEFDERITAALAARTQGDLDVLFLDLPGRRPGHQRATGRYAPTGQPGEMTPVEWEDQPKPEAPRPWWTHWGLLVLLVALSGPTRGRLGIFIPLVAVWVFWLGPVVAQAQHNRRLVKERRREIGR